ncbi:hypothetical protein [Brooklawnia sp.]
MARSVIDLETRRKAHDRAEPRQDQATRAQAGKSWDETLIIAGHQPP